MQKDKLGFLNIAKIAGTVLPCLFVLGVALPVWAAGENNNTDRAFQAERDRVSSQLNRDRNLLEQERIRREIEEGKKERGATIENRQSGNEKESANSVSFELKQVNVAESKVLQAEEIKQLTDAYIGKEANLQTLIEITEKINELYAKNGYVTCKAYLPAQRIHEGVVEISLFEGVTGNISVEGNKSTSADYITDRVPLKKGEVANVHDISDALVLFNATNDAQLQLVIDAGTEPGTSDFFLHVREPQRTQVSVMVDNAGSYNSGEWREGVFFTDRSLSGKRDALTVGYLRSAGSDAVTGSYSIPINKNGTQLHFGYTTNSVEVKKGNGAVWGIKGHAYAASVGVKQPLLVNAKTRQEFTLDLGRQKSVTYLKFSRRNIVDENLQDINMGFAQTDYGASHAFYQKHSFNFGKIKNISNNNQSFKTYGLNAFYQKVYQHGQQISARFDGQYSFKKNIRSQRQYYIGGMYSVRGYKENLLYGDGGITTSVEYSIPLGDKKTDAYIFTDYGTLQGDDLIDTTLWSYGFGVRSRLTEHISMNLALGIPIKDNIDPSMNGGKKIKSGRVHFSLNGTF